MAAMNRQRELEALLADLAEHVAGSERSAASATEAAVAARRRARACRRRCEHAYARAAEAHDRAVNVALSRGDSDRATHHRDKADVARRASARHHAALATSR